jgi:hypothetical protein
MFPELSQPETPGEGSFERLYLLSRSILAAIWGEVDMGLDS